MNAVDGLAAVAARRSYIMRRGVALPDDELCRLLEYACYEEEPFRPRNIIFLLDAVAELPGLDHGIFRVTARGKLSRYQVCLYYGDGQTYVIEFDYDAPCVDAVLWQARPAPPVCDFIVHRVVAPVRGTEPCPRGRSVSEMTAREGQLYRWSPWASFICEQGHWHTTRTQLDAQPEPEEPPSEVIVPESTHEVRFADLHRSAQEVVRTAALCGWRVRVRGWQERDARGKTHAVVRVQAVAEHTAVDGKVRHGVSAVWRDLKASTAMGIVDVEGHARFMRISMTDVRPLIRQHVKPGSPGEVKKTPAKKAAPSSPDPYRSRAERLLT